MTTNYQHLGIFSDWVEEARRQRGLFGPALPGRETRGRLAEVLGFCSGPEAPLGLRVESSWEKDGLVGEELSWSVGYGPRTHAWLLKPAGNAGPLPGVVALHDHGGFKFFGKEKIAEGPDAPPPVLRDFQAKYYGGRAWANALAKGGFAVLIPDTFLWGSRRFPIETMPEVTRNLVDATRELWMAGNAAPEEIARYNAATGHHEHLVEKYCNLLGTTLAGVVSHEDRIAVNVLRARPEVDPARVGCCGLSGGGNRSALLLATHDGIAAAVIVGLMSTYEGLLDHNVASHTWMLFPNGWSRHGDWPDIAACRAPMPLLVQYDSQDDLFTPAGMQAAHDHIAGHYVGAGQPDADAGQPGAYTGQFYPGPHKFDLAMQEAAFGWLKKHLDD
jgi:dienelactone hydrolase